jgi:hypothetical protein
VGELEARGWAWERGGSCYDRIVRILGFKECAGWSIPIGIEAPLRSQAPSSSLDTMSAGRCLRVSVRTSAIEPDVFVGAAKMVAGASTKIRDRAFVKIIVVKFLVPDCLYI